MAARRVIPEADASRTASVAAQQVRGYVGFVDEDVAARIVQRLRVAPMAAGRGDIRPTLFVGVYGFF